jgi:hypothetical protein
MAPKLTHRVAVVLLLAAGGLTAAPVPKGQPGERQPTPEELAAAQKAYAGLGGSYELGPAGRHVFALPRSVPEEVFGRLPELPFEYTLVIDVGPNLQPGTLKALKRLTHLRRLTLIVDHRRDNTPDPASLVADLAALPGLRHLEFGPADHGPFADDLAEEVVKLTGLKSLCGNGPLTDRGLEHLAALPGMEALELRGCEGLTDASVPTLAKMRDLRRIDLTRTKVTPDGLRRLRRSLPEARVEPEQK